MVCRQPRSRRQVAQSGASTRIAGHRSPPEPPWPPILEVEGSALKGIFHLGAISATTETRWGCLLVARPISGSRKQLWQHFAAAQRHARLSTPPQRRPTAMAAKGFDDEAIQRTRLWQSLQTAQRLWLVANSSSTAGSVTADRRGGCRDAAALGRAEVLQRLRALTKYHKGAASQRRLAPLPTDRPPESPPGFSNPTIRTTPTAASCATSSGSGDCRRGHAVAADASGQALRHLQPVGSGKARSFRRAGPAAVFAGLGTRSPDRHRVCTDTRKTIRDQVTSTSPRPSMDRLRAAGYERRLHLFGRGCRALS